MSYSRNEAFSRLAKVGYDWESYHRSEASREDSADLLQRLDMIGSHITEVKLPGKIQQTCKGWI